MAPHLRRQTQTPARRSSEHDFARNQPARLKAGSYAQERTRTSYPCGVRSRGGVSHRGRNRYLWRKLLPSSLEERPYSDKYELLKPGGTIGLKLGIFGTVLFFIIFLYALRKVIPWLGRFGTARHWMDFHVIAGVTAPVIIAFHASFKFSGIAGFAFWIMLAVALSGVIGRYLYSQIPRSLSAAEMSLTELHLSEQELSDALLGQSVYSAEQLSRADAGALGRVHPAHRHPSGHR